MKRGLQVVLTLLVLGALGAATAYGISSALGIRVEPKEVPAEVLRAAPPRESVAPPRVRVTAPDGVRLDAARAELRDATADGEGTATLRVRFGDGDDDDDSYRLTGTADQLRIRAASETGAVRGVYDLAQAAWAHRPLTERLGETVTSRLPFRMVDLGAAGVDPDPEQWRGGTDYSHYSRAFEDVLLPEAPWIDEAALADARDGPPRLRRARAGAGLQRRHRARLPGVRHLRRGAGGLRRRPGVRRPGGGGAGRVRPAVGRARRAGPRRLPPHRHARAQHPAGAPPHRTVRPRPDRPRALGRLRGGARRALRRAPAAVRCRAPHRRGRVDLQHPGHRLLLRDHGDHGARRPGDARRLHRSGGARRQGRRLPDLERRRRCGG